VFNQLKHFRSDKELSVITAFFRAPLADPVVGLWSIIHQSFTRHLNFSCVRRNKEAS
jgi:hypothetical protein